jgi:hypothetical protein
MLQMNDWLAEPRDGESAEPADPGHAEPIGPGYAVPASHGYAGSAGPGHAESASYVHAVSASPGYAVPEGHGRAEPADGGARPEAVVRPEAVAAPVAPAAVAARAAVAAPAAAATPARTVNPAGPARPAAAAAPAGPAEATARAVIGDQLRMPIMWCEMGSCISWHADPEALGEADARARAIGAGWRIDAFGRLACPRCQRTDPGYRAARQVVPWERDTAATAPIPAAPGDVTSGRAAWRSSRDHGRAVSGYPPATRAELEWHHDLPAGEAMPADRYAENPEATSDSRGLVFSAVRAWRARGGRQAASRQASEHSEDLMIRERAHAGSAGAATLTGRRW